MKRILWMVALGLLWAAGRASAVVISGTNISVTAALVVDPNHPPQQVPGYGMGVVQNLSGDGTEVLFAYTGNALQEAATALDEGSDLYLAPQGAFFSASTIGAGDFTPIFVETVGTNPVVNIPLGDFYLGVNTGTGFSTDYRSVFGWVELHNDGTTLTPVGNAVAHEESGIVVGAPEPSCAVLLMLGISLPTAWRRGVRARRIPRSTVGAL